MDTDADYLVWMGTVMNKYMTLVHEIEQAVAEGKLSHGDKLTSVRELSRSSKLGVNTVLKAYEILEERGVITSKAQSGYYVLGDVSSQVCSSGKVQSVPTEVKSADVVTMLFDSARSSSMIPFGAACMSPKYYPHRELNAVTRSVLREMPEATSLYSLPPGDLEYRKQISKYLKQHQVVIKPEELMATNGAMEAIILALRSVCEPGDTVVVESPHYFGSLQAMESLGIKAIEVPSCPINGLDLERLKDAVKKNKIKAAIVMPNISNPLGTLLTDERKKEVVEILQSKGITIIEDDVYADLAFQPERPRPLRSFGDPQNIITCASFSKTLSPALRVGWIAPGKFYKTTQRLQLSSTVGGNMLSQKVIARFLPTKDFQRHMGMLKLQCSIELNRVSQHILNTFPEGTKVSSPKGGYVLWVEMPKAVNSVRLYQMALEKKISVSPGTIFSANNHYQNFIRVNCGNEWNPRIESALTELGRMTKRFL